MRNKFQPGIQFKTIDQLLDYIPTKERKIVEILRDIILDTLPHCTEKLSYNVPYYSLKKRICFIWPGSVPWGKVKEGVMIGFTYGSQLTDLGYLDKGNRKTVFTKTYFSPTDMDSKIITTLLLESAIIDKR